MNLFEITRLQPRAWSLLARSFSAGRTASTYLFYGREGLGEWPLALAFAALLNCRKPSQSDAADSGVVYPCGECPACKSIAAVNFEGLHVIVPIKSHKSMNEAVDLTNAAIDFKREHPYGTLDRTQSLSLPIDMAREVKKRLSVKGSSGIIRLALFYQMDSMRDQSKDALLKLIEEPPSDTVIVMTATRLEQLPQTVRSRSQRVKLDRVPLPALIEFLTRVHGAPEAKAKLAARLSDGSPGRAIEMLSDEDEEAGQRAVGLMLFRSLVADSGPETVSQITELLPPNDRGGCESLLQLWQSLIRDCAWHASSGEEEDIVNSDFTAEIRRLSRPFADAAAVRRMVDQIKNTLADMSRNVHIQTALVALVLKLKSELQTARLPAAKEV